MGNYAEFIGRLGTNEESDECYTPHDAMNPLLPFIDSSKTWYEATSDKSSKIVESLTASNIDIRSSVGRDFFDCSEEDIFDGVITNPPYSKKTEFLEHCFRLRKPFALLLPVAAIQSQKRGSLFIEHGISLLVYNRRVDFTGKKAPPFGVAWFMGNGFAREENKLYFADN